MFHPPNQSRKLTLVGEGTWLLGMKSRFISYPLKMPTVLRRVFAAIVLLACFSSVSVP